MRLVSGRGRRDVPRELISKEQSGSSIMDNQQKRPNAYKHGIFAAMTIIPGEDPEEFEKLHADLIEEWIPAGATEEDSVLTIAKGVWRKRRLQKFIEVRLIKNSLDPSHPSYDESVGLFTFSEFMRRMPEVAFERWAKRLLRDDKVNYLKQKFPRWDFKSTAEWAQAVMDEITSVLLPASTIDGQWMVPSLSLSAATFTDDFFKQELALDERLDAMIDRAVKRLVQTKAMKQMLAQASTERVEIQPRAIAPRRELL
jgi:hypothetical protein